MKSTSLAPLFIFLAACFLISCDKIPDENGATISDITITSLKPAHGPFDTIDTLIGKNFDKIPALDSVLLNGKKLTLISRTNEQVIVKIPSMAGTGNIDIWYQGKVIHGPVFTYDSTFFVTTLAGSSTEVGAVDGQGLDARFNTLQGIAVDKTGNVYVADNAGIRKITSTGNVTTLAGSLLQPGYADGTGAAARFGEPWGLAIGPDDYLYLGDRSNVRIRKISLSGVVTTLAGIWHGPTAGPLQWQLDGDASVATFTAPLGVTVDAQNNVYTADISCNKIRKITPAGFVSSICASDYYNSGFRDGTISNALFFNPGAVAADPAGNIFVNDWGNRRLRKISANGTVTTLLGPMEPAITGTSVLFESTALATDKKGNLFFSIPGGIMKMTTDGQFIRFAMGGIGETDGPAKFATYRAIKGIAVDDAGNLFITDNHRVRKIGWQ